jgi:hypothetical protein
MFAYGFNVQRNRKENDAFLNEAQTEALSRDMSIELRPVHLSGKLIPCRWDLRPVYTMVDLGIWDDPCRLLVDQALADDAALDSLTLMFYGGHYSSDGQTIMKICSYDIYSRRVQERLSSSTIDDADRSVQIALKKALGRH